MVKLPEPFPQFDLVGPTVDDEIRRLIGRYGQQKVQEALKGQTARSRGRIPENDWPELREILREDARSWLEGSDPFKARSNGSIARDFAAKHLGHSYDAMRDRLMRKLGRRRRYYTLIEAAWLSETEFPHTEHLRVISALRELGVRRELWDRLFRLHEGSLADYRSKFGEPPARMTMQELVAESARPIAGTAGFLPGNVLQNLVGSGPQ